MKIGDKIRCVNIAPSLKDSTFINGYPLTLGKIYTFIGINYNHISVICDNGLQANYQPCRFILVPKTINTNIKVL